MTLQDTFEALKYCIEIDNNGARFYYNSSDELHRIDGPAIEFASGSKFWYVNSMLHRTDGPAVEYANGGKAWYVDGVEYTESEFNALVKK